MKIMVTPRSFSSTSDKPKNLLEEKYSNIDYNDTGKPYSKEVMKEKIKNVDGIIIGIDPLDEEVLKEAKDLKIISKYGVGTDNIDLDYASKNNIVVTNTPNANNNAVADLAFGLMITLARRIVEADYRTKSDEWGKIIGSAVNNKVLGVIGLGKIGKEVVKRAQGFNMEVMVYDIEEDEEFKEKYGVEYVSKEDLLKKADFISIHTPLTPQTKDLITKRELEMMKETSFLVNTSRGGIVNEEDLYYALKENLIKGAAFDAFVNEPPEDSPLKELDNIIMTSHMGAYTVEAIEKMGVDAVKNLIAVLEGEEPENNLI